MLVLSIPSRGWWVEYQFDNNTIDANWQIGKNAVVYTQDEPFCNENDLYMPDSRIFLSFWKSEDNASFTIDSYILYDVNGAVLYTTARPGSEGAIIPFDSVGLNGWESENGQWYYYESGSVKTGWLLWSENNRWYYLDPDGNGVMVTGRFFTQPENRWSLFEDNGAWIGYED